MADFGFSDAWIMQAIYLVRGTEAVELRDVIQAADYINKSVPTYEEINHACSSLTELNFLEIAEGRIRLTRSGLGFYREATQLSNLPPSSIEITNKIAERLSELVPQRVGFEEHFARSDVKVALRS